jgi:hypothetical protein
MELVKILSSNDVGATGGHQAGVVIPKSVAKGDFFPVLDSGLLNPRQVLFGTLLPEGTSVKLNYIYYNGRLHNSSTRNEYRLTGISSFLKDFGAQEGDKLILTKIAPDRYSLRIEIRGLENNEERLVVRLSKDWVIRRNRN